MVPPPTIPPVPAPSRGLMIIPYRRPTLAAVPAFGHVPCAGPELQLSAHMQSAFVCCIFGCCWVPGFAMPAPSASSATAAAGCRTRARACHLKSQRCLTSHLMLPRSNGRAVRRLLPLALGASQHTIKQ